MEDIITTGRPDYLIRYLQDVDQNKNYDLSEHTERKRTLTSNAYYWRLIEQLVIKTRIPKQKLHNMYLRDVGKIKKIAGNAAYVLLPDDDETEEATLKASYHIMPTKNTYLGEDKKKYRWYVMIKGSHDFNTEEMATLIDLVQQDCETYDIETLSYDELERIRERERKKENEIN